MICGTRNFDPLQRRETLIFSFIVDQEPAFIHQAWILAQSLEYYCDAIPSDINVQFTAEAKRWIPIFSDRGYRIHCLEHFGDRRWCNKLSQLPNLLSSTFDRVVLLDTDTIVVNDFRPFIYGSAVQAKIVDNPRPDLQILKTIFDAAGLMHSGTVRADSSEKLTLHGNANGGFYAIPEALAARFSSAWRRWAEWLLQNDEPLRRDNALMHVDQVSAMLAFADEQIPFSAAPANINYYIHFPGDHYYMDYTRPIALLHYHDVMTLDGLIEPRHKLGSSESHAVESANAFIDKHRRPLQAARSKIGA